MANVLVVDDAAFMRASIKRILEENGYDVIGEAANGAEAVDKFSELKPDVVILDITMPEMNGIEALKRIKEIDATARVIICSAIGYQDMLAKAIECGAKEFIVKPFEAKHLVQAIEKVLGGC